MTTAVQCARCQMPIIEPRTQVVRDEKTYCCPNCAAAESGAAAPAEGRCCAECGVAIVDESTMETRGDDAYCCRNCLEAMSASSAR